MKNKTKKNWIKSFARMEAAGALSLSLLSLIIRLSNIRHSSFPVDLLFWLFLMTHSKKTLLQSWLLTSTATRWWSQAKVSWNAASTISSVIYSRLASFTVVTLRPRATVKAGALLWVTLPWATGAWTQCTGLKWSGFGAFFLSSVTCKRKLCEY